MLYHFGYFKYKDIISYQLLILINTVLNYVTLVLITNFIVCSDTLLGNYQPFYTNAYIFHQSSIVRTQKRTLRSGNFWKMLIDER